MKKAKKLLHLITVLSLLAGLANIGAGTSTAAAAAAEKEPGRAEMQAVRTLTAPVIDGRLEESFWSVSEPLSVRTDPVSNEDHRFGLLWDDTYLYIGVRIADETPITGGSGYWFDQDSLNLFFDPTLHRSSPFAPEDMQIGLLYGQDGSTPEFRFGAALNNHADKDEKKVLRSIHTTPEGWSAELAVPWDMLHMDPRLQKQLGLEVGVTNRYDAADTAKQRTNYWSAYNSSSFWNDTTGYGVVQLSDDAPVSGFVDPVLLEENFEGYNEGTIPPGWVSDVNGGSPAFTVTRDTYSSVTGDTYGEAADPSLSGKRLRFDGNGSGWQARITAPVQADNYTVEADVRFESVLNPARWAALMFRVPSNGKAPYNQMAVRQNGAYELAYRNPANQWSVPESGTWQPLTLGKDYTLKVRVFGDHVKEYIKARDEAEFALLVDATLDSGLLKRGKVGFQADQAAVSFDNLKVTRLTADRLDLLLPNSAEALSGPLTVTATVYYSDGVVEPLQIKDLKLYSSDESVVKIVDNRPVPVKEGEAVITGVYHQAESRVNVTVTPSLTGPKVLKLAHDPGYLLMEAGKPVPLKDIRFTAESSDYTAAEIDGSQLNWSAYSGEVTADGMDLTVKSPGVYEVKAAKDGAEFRLVLVAKAADQHEYVLFAEDFDGMADGAFPEGWTRKQGASESAAGVRDGAFEMRATVSPDNPSRVLLPDYLSLFGDYAIEADITNTAANNSGRWNSIMFRVQNGDSPYYQMAVRKDPSVYNGVEFAERTASNQWNVMERGSYPEPMEEGKPLRYTVKAYGNRVQEWINELLIIDTAKAEAYSKGHIGFQADGSTMRIDNIRVTLLEQPLPVPDIKPFVKVSEPATRIPMAPTVVTEVVYGKDLAKLEGGSLPATAIFHVNADLAVTEKNGGKVISRLDEVIAATGEKVIPAFYVTEELAVDRLVHELRERGLEDAFVISDRPDLIRRARAAYPVIRGIADFTSMVNPTPEQLLDIRRQTASSQARVALLPAGAATRDNVAFLQKLAVMVWAQSAPNTTGGSLPTHRLITAGVNGLVTADPAKAREALELYGRDTTLIRKVYMIGHRGMPSVSPENTIESNILAIEAGADYIENDMFLTKDGYLIITHNTLLETTTDGRGQVENFTLEELKALNANKPYPQGFPLVRMPTLDEQLQLARERGRLVYAEIKTQTPEAVDAFVSTVKKYKAEDIVNVMSFYPAQLERLAVLMPEMNAGLLTGYMASEANVEGSLRETIKALSRQNWTYNTDYNGLGPKFLEAAKHRGLLISPWTLNKREDIIKYFKMGAFAITTDYTYYASDWAAALTAKEPAIVLNKGESRALNGVAETYRGDKKEVQPDIVVIEGGNLVRADGNTIKAVGSGKAYALLRYSASIEGGGTYDLYSEPVEITVHGGNDGGGGTPGNGGGNGGGGNSGSHSGAQGVPGTPIGNEAEQPDGSADTTVIEAINGAVKAEDLKQALEAEKPIEVRFKGESVRIPLAGLKPESLKRDEAVLTLVNSELQAGYRLPLRRIDPAVATRLLGGSAADTAELVVTVRELKESEKAAVAEAAGRAGGTLGGPAVEFGLRLSSGDGSAPQRSVSFSIEGAVQYIGALGDAKSRTWTGVRFDRAGKKLVYAPSRYVSEASEVILTRGQSGIYTVLAEQKAFADMKGHWAETEASKLAERLLLEGTGSGAFEPGRAVTRAEFAAMLVRALGLDAEAEAVLAAGNGEAAPPAMKDVATAAWFAPYVRAAVRSGLVGGYGDGTFRPDAQVTRGEQAAMMARAMRISGSAAVSGPADGSGRLAGFKDAGEIRWGRADWETVLEAGLFNGVAGNRLNPAAASSRAESAVLLYRFLQWSGDLE
ncbi:glycerophosphodiester phosphodiesterase family protein [Paenibacillus sanfengchensis]|uniref:glycerophosphodiester phosphodiesterase family protein n=1 Tax=Paenibacillus sanfengchensis TaxID=3119819 RepID=UPI002FE000FC